MSTSNIHSHGRGGAGNIGTDTDTYVDGETVRNESVSNPAVAHIGRGGAGNVTESPKLGPQDGKIVNVDEVHPGEAHQNFHTGRGGEGNIHREEFGGHSKAQGEHHEGLLDKAKHALGLDHKKEQPKTSE